ncbi:MAG: hypothetical protein ABI689_11780 [Thermoanaerobaculia bacterium]
MRRFAPNALVLFALVVAVGCQSKSETATQAAPAAPQAVKPAAATPAATPAAPGETGVAECDEYLRKWDACLATKITGDAHEQVKVALDATREAWKRKVATPEGKAGLAAACRDAADVAEMQVASYGCTW